MNLDDYEVLVRKEVVIVLPSNTKESEKIGNEMPLSLAIANVRNKPFMTYGLPKDVKKYVCALIVFSILTMRGILRSPASWQTVTSVRTLT